MQVASRSRPQIETSPATDPRRAPRAPRLPTGKIAPTSGSGGREPEHEQGELLFHEAKLGWEIPDHDGVHTPFPNLIQSK